MNPYALEIVVSVLPVLESAVNSLLHTIALIFQDVAVGLLPHSSLSNVIFNALIIG